MDYKLGNFRGILKTQVLIIGGGPSGLLLSQLLMKAGIETIILEKQSRQYILNRIRAGVIEPNSVEVLKNAGIGDRIDAEGIKHQGTILSHSNHTIRIDFKKATKKAVTVYGQTEITKDLFKAQDNLNAKIFHGIKNIQVENLCEKSPRIIFDTETGEKKYIEADFIAGCDGFHGISRSWIPEKNLSVYENRYPFGWLGILSETPPVNDELIYSSSSSGFALASMRSSKLSRYYIQCDLDTKPEDYTDDFFWLELKKRLPKKYSEKLITGPSIEKSIAPLRSFVVEPIQYGKLYLAGDAAHIVPPTGAKGLNLAISDIYYLSQAFITFYNDNEKNLLESYSQIALKRIWKTVRFSWWMTTLLHTFPNSSHFEKKIQSSEFFNLSESQYAMGALAENYVGLPY